MFIHAQERYGNPMCISVYNCDCDQSSGPLKVPLWTPKGFMDPRLRTPAIDPTISEKKLKQLFLIKNEVLLSLHWRILK